MVHIIELVGQPKVEFAQQVTVSIIFHITTQKQKKKTIEKN